MDLTGDITSDLTGDVTSDLTGDITSDLTGDITSDLTRDLTGDFTITLKSNPCPFWVWGDVQAVAKPKCRNGFPSVVRKVKKETVNKDRLFFCCAQEDSCNYFNTGRELYQR